tara:strand:- start:3606 stop:3914 length:309 start_codon:yes stop_codon:yes gene_type:complete
MTINKCLGCGVKPEKREIVRESNLQKTVYSCAKGDRFFVVYAPNNQSEEMYKKQHELFYKNLSKLNLENKTQLLIDPEAEYVQKVKDITEAKNIIKDITVLV